MVRRLTVQNINDDCWLMQLGWVELELLILCGRVLPCFLVALVPVLVFVLVLVGGCALAA